jgi:hypothetical protein
MIATQDVMEVAMEDAIGFGKVVEVVTLVVMEVAGTMEGYVGRLMKEREQIATAHPVQLVITQNHVRRMSARHAQRGDMHRKNQGRHRAVLVIKANTRVQ